MSKSFFRQLIKAGAWMLVGIWTALAIVLTCGEETRADGNFHFPIWNVIGLAMLSVEVLFFKIVGDNE